MRFRRSTLRLSSPPNSVRNPDGRASAQYGPNGELLGSNLVTRTANSVQTVSTGPDGITVTNLTFHALRTLAQIYGPPPRPCIGGIPAP